MIDFATLTRRRDRKFSRKVFDFRAGCSILSKLLLSGVDYFRSWDTTTTTTTNEVTLRHEITVYTSPRLRNSREENLSVAAAPEGFRWRLVGVSRPVITIRTHPLHARSHACPPLRRRRRRRRWYTSATATPRVGVHGRRQSVCDLTQEARRGARAGNDRPGTRYAR